MGNGKYRIVNIDEVVKSHAAVLSHIGRQQSNGTTVEGLIRILDLDAKQVGKVSLNGALVSSGRKLEEGTELKIFQPISGG